jgi:hypothetical protein
VRGIRSRWFRTPSPYPSPLRGEGGDCGSLGAKRLARRKTAIGSSHLRSDRLIRTRSAGKVASACPPSADRWERAPCTLATLRANVRRRVAFRRRPAYRCAEAAGAFRADPVVMNGANDEGLIVRRLPAAPAARAEERRSAVMRARPIRRCRGARAPSPREAVGRVARTEGPSRVGCLHIPHPVRRCASNHPPLRADARGREKRVRGPRVAEADRMLMQRSRRARRSRARVFDRRGPG